MDWNSSPQSKCYYENNGSYRNNNKVVLYRDVDVLYERFWSRSRVDDDAYLVVLSGLNIDLSSVFYGAKRPSMNMSNRDPLVRGKCSRVMTSNPRTPSVEEPLSINSRTLLLVWLPTELYREVAEHMPRSRQSNDADCHRCYKCQHRFSASRNCLWTMRTKQRLSISLVRHLTIGWTGGLPPNICARIFWVVTTPWGRGSYGKSTITSSKWPIIGSH